MTEQATVDTSEVATAEDLRAFTFEAMSDVKIPDAKAWMERAATHRQVLGIGWGTLRCSSAELAQIMRDHEADCDWCDLYESLTGIEGFYKAVLEDIGVMTARLMVAMCQAFPDETT